MENKNLEPNDITPLYAQLKSVIRNKINTGEYPENFKIPSENELSVLYNISRVTVRKAIEELVEEGYLSRKKGKGSFVNHNIEFDKIDYINSFTQCLIKNGMEPSTVLLKRRIIPADVELAKKLKITKGDEVLYTQRIRFANGRPVVLEGNYFPLKDYGFLVNEDLTGSLYQILEKRDIHAIHPSPTTLELCLSDHEVSTIMKVPFNTPFFYIKTVMNDQNNCPIHYGKQFYLAEAYRFTLND